MCDRSNDPAFLYFPDHYRWSMGLLICLGGAPWGGAEIDEVNRVGRALRDKVGDDAAWFAEWSRMGEAVEARGRAAENVGHAHTAAACLLRATRYYQTGERFLQPKSQRGLDVYAKSVRAFRDAAALMRRPRIRGLSRSPAHKSDYFAVCWRSLDLVEAHGRDALDWNYFKARITSGQFIG